MKALTWKAMLDDSDFRKKIKDAQQYAKDTWKLLDKKHVLQLEFNKTQADAKVKQLQSLLRNKDLDEAKKIVLSIDLTRAKKEAIEANAILNNYLNTGNEKLSRFRSAFQDLKTGFFQIWGAVASAIGFWVGALAKWITSSVTWYFRDSILLAKEYETAFAGVRKTVKATEIEFQGLKNQLKDMATRIPMSFWELASIMEQGGQLGVEKENLAKFTEVVAKLGIATNMTSEAAADLLAKYANILKMPLSQIDQLGAVIVQLGNNFATTESDVTNFSSRIAGAGKIANMNAAEIMAIATAFSSVGIEAEAGGTAVQKVLLDMNTAVVSWGKQLNAYAKAIWISAEQFKKMRKEDSTWTFVKFIQKLWDAGQEAQLILNDLHLTDQRLTRSFLSLAQNSKILTDAVTMANEARKENTALSAEAEQRFATTESKIQMEQNKRANSMAAVGEWLLGLNLLWEQFKTWFVESIQRIVGVSKEHNTITEELLWNIASLTEEMKKLRGEYDSGAISIEEYARQMAKLEKQKSDAEKAKDKELRRLEEISEQVKIQNKDLEFNIKWYGYLQKKIEELTAAGKEHSKEMETQKRMLEFVGEKIQKNKDSIEELNASYEYGAGTTAERVKANKKTQEAQSKLNETLDAFNSQEVKKDATIEQFEALRKQAIETAKGVISLYEAESLLWTIKKSDFTKFSGWQNLWNLVKKNGFSVSARTQTIQGNKQLTDAKKQLAELENLDYKSRKGTWSSNNNKFWGSWGGKDALAKKKEELKKLRDLQIEQIKDSEQSERDKYKSILKVNEDYKKKLADLEWKSNDEIIKQAEDAAKDEERIIKDKYSKINKAIEKSEGNLKDYWKQIQEVKKKWKDALTDMKKQLQDLNHEMKELDQNYTDEQADRWVEVKNQIKNNSRDNSGLDRITQNYDKKTIEQRRDAGQKEINNIDIDKVIEQLNLKEEEAFLEGKITEEKRKQAEENSKLSESQKRDIQYQKDKLILQEKINIAKAFSSQKDFFDNKLSIWENSDWSLKASYIDENWEEKQVTDYKNIQYLADLANKQAVMKKEIEDLELKTAEEYKIYETLNQQKADLEKNQTEILQEEIQKRKNEVSSYVDHYEKEANRQLDIAKNLAQQMQSYAAQYVAAKASMWGGGSTTNITNHAGNTVNQTYNINNPSDASAAIFRAATERLIN